MKNIKFLSLLVICGLTFFNSTYPMDFLRYLCRNVAAACEIEPEATEQQEQQQCQEQLDQSEETTRQQCQEQHSEEHTAATTASTNMTENGVEELLGPTLLANLFASGMPASHSGGWDREEHNRQEASYYEDDCEEIPKDLVHMAIDIAPDEVIKKLKNIENKKENKNIEIRKPFLFIGSPGTGKSTVAKVLAQYLCKTAGFKWKALRGTQIEGEVQNSGERNLRTAFSPIKNAINDRWIVTIDEADNFIARHHDARQIRDEGAVQEFNLSLDTFRKHPNIVIICITNNLDVFPPAFKSRFQQINFKLPNAESRRKIILYFLNKLRNNGYCIAPNCFGEVFIEDISQRETEGMSIREIEGALRLDLVDDSDDNSETKEQMKRRFDGINDQEDHTRQQLETIIRQNDIIQALQKNKSLPTFLDSILEQVKEQTPESVRSCLESRKDYLKDEILKRVLINFHLSHLRPRESEQVQGAAATHVQQPSDLRRFIPGYEQALQERSQVLQKRILEEQLANQELDRRLKESQRRILEGQLANLELDRRLEAWFELTQATKDLIKFN